MILLHDSRRSPVRTLVALLAATLITVIALAGQSASAASVAGYVLDIHGDADAVQVVYQDEVRPLNALEPVYPGMRIEVAPGPARVTLDIAGARHTVSADTSPLVVEEPGGNASVGGNLVSWAMSLLSRDEDVLRTVGAVSRSTQHNPMPWLPTAEPSEMAISNVMFFIWRGEAPPDAIRLYQDDALLTDRFVLPGLQLAALPLPPLAPGEYELDICFSDTCRRHPLVFATAPELPPGTPDADANDSTEAMYQALYLLQRGGPAHWPTAVQHVSRHYRQHALAEALFADISGR
ncbi:MAG: hypothetical protein LAT61_12775 [Alcanivorax sp.]|nr:hypothetical protein [Alcanivorax sp.]